MNNENNKENFSPLNKIILIKKVEIYKYLSEIDNINKNLSFGCFFSFILIYVILFIKIFNLIQIF